MKKIMIIAMLAIGLSACSSEYAQKSADRSKRLICIDGVEYMVFVGAYSDPVTPHLKLDGKPYACRAPVRTDDTGARAAAVVVAS